MHILYSNYGYRIDRRGDSLFLSSQALRDLSLRHTSMTCGLISALTSSSWFLFRAKSFLNQWMKVIRDHFSNLQFIIAHEERSESRYAKFMSKGNRHERDSQRAFALISKFQRYTSCNKFSWREDSKHSWTAESREPPSLTFMKIYNPPLLFIRAANHC
jgi:hypothetical protein